MLLRRVELKHEPGDQTNLSLYPKQNVIVSVVTDLRKLLDLRGS